VKVIWPLLLLVSCSEPRTPERSSPAGAPFPHLQDYRDPTLHGADLRIWGLAKCEDCHGRSDSTAPACSTCHEIYPHPEGWVTGSMHGEGLTSRIVDLQQCTRCHDKPGLVATDEYGCTSCHASFPHPEGWSHAQNHGVYALARPDVKAVCGSCHGEDLGGGDVGVACNKCHSVWPHPDDWKDPTVHGVTALDHLDDCAGCHSTEGVWDGGPTGVACSRCHQVFPHAADWKVKHATQASKVGEPICMRCHQPGDGPATMVATCAPSCHGGAE